MLDFEVYIYLVDSFRTIMAGLFGLQGVVCRTCLDRKVNTFTLLINRYFLKSIGKRKFSICRNSLRLSKQLNRVFKLDPKPINSFSKHSYCTSTYVNDGKKGYIPDVSVIERTIEAKYERGLCLITLPLYSRDEMCKFVLKPLLNTLNDLFHSIRAEDAGIEKMRAFTSEGELISQNTTCSNLLKQDFVLELNDLYYLVKVEDFACPYVAGDSARNLIAQLYMAMNSEEIFVKRQELLQQKLEDLQMELLPMEKNLAELHDLAKRKARMMAWTGLSLMGFQFGILARLTWWDYSWDVMEPVTYFITYGTIMAMFSYYIVTNQEYIYPEVNDRLVLKQLHKICKSAEFDIGKYNDLTSEVNRLKFELTRLRDPLRLQLHPPHLKPNTVLPTL